MTDSTTTTTSSASSSTSPYLYEFLYRGRAPGSSEAPDYHVILAQDAEDAFGNTNTSMSPAMTPDQAKAMGFDLPAITSAINAGTMAENATLKTRLADVQAQAQTAADAAAAEIAATAP